MIIEIGADQKERSPNPNVFSKLLSIYKMGLTWTRFLENAGKYINIMDGKYT